MMLRRMQSMTMRDLGMMGGLLGITGLMMLCRLAVMRGCMLVVIGCLLVVFVDIVAAHDALPGLARIGLSTIARANDAPATLLFRHADIRHVGGKNAAWCNSCRSASTAPVQSPNWR